MQGFNMGRYRPPSTLDPSLSSTSAPKTPHPLGHRARKLPQGILTIRFEMPFAIWCSTCPSKTPSSLIGQGVRFNAEKKRVGNYFSTPIWSFRMKHAACGGWIEIRTDPKSTEYVVTEGARKRDYGDSAVVAERVGGVVLGDDEAEKERRRLDAFAALEGKVDDKIRAKSEGARLEELRSLKERDWRDVDERNRVLRREFRVGRKEREREEKSRGVLMDKMSLGIEIVAETEEDRRRAALVEFGSVENMSGENDMFGSAATRKPLFAMDGGSALSKKQTVTEARLTSLRQELSVNTRAIIDPFTPKDTTTSSSTGMRRAIPGVRSKRQTQSTDNQSVISDNVQGEVIQIPLETTLGKTRGSERDTKGLVSDAEVTAKPSLSLVEYDSD